MKYPLCLAACLWIVSATAEPVWIEGGPFQSPVILDENITVIDLASFHLDAMPVTNRVFLQFVTRHPQWQKDQVPGLFADSNYLRHWPSPQTINDDQADRPVTRVSWFAARAYCQAQGGRLPTLDEWEYVSVRIRVLDGISDQEYARRVFSWYNNPDPQNMPAVAQGAASNTGIYDFHGVINEWVENFQLLMSNGDSTDLLSGSCGDTARFMASYDTASYATFLRYQSRSNYQPRSTTSTLGFRCAYSL